jgi:hypothetical protein
MLSMRRPICPFEDNKRPIGVDYAHDSEFPRHLDSMACCPTNVRYLSGYWVIHFGMTVLPARGLLDRKVTY